MKWILGVMLVLSVGCTGPLDKSLMEMRAQAVGNERLYVDAAYKFAGVYEQLSEQKHAFQRQLILQAEKGWLERHTESGMVQSTPEEFLKMLEQRDAAWAQYDESRGKSRRVVEDYRRMVRDKLAFTEVLFAREQNAQAAKESLAASLDSLGKMLLGAVPAVATFLPLAF